MQDASAPPSSAAAGPAASAASAGSAAAGPVVIKSRLLKQLDKDIAAATSPMASAAARAKRAMLLARHGAVGEAREALTALHQLSFQHPHPEIGAWLHMAEGLMSYYNGFVAQQAWDRIQRAHAIAGTSPALIEVRVLASAWLSQLAFIRHDPVALVDYARRCLGEALPEHNVAQARLAITMGLAWHYAGDLASAQRWYIRARRHASVEGDDASLSALMFNMAGMRASQLRRESLSSQTWRGSELMLSVDSVHHFDEAVGAQMMTELTPVLRAQVLTMQGGFDEARRLYEEHLPQAMSLGLERLGSSLLSDLAWCRANLGQHEHALHQAREAEIELDPECELDDRAITHSRLAQTFRMLGETADADRHQALADEAWLQFAEQQQQWRDLLAGSALEA
jgi:tetratricopeptide (TPR) repeat protein